MKVISIKTFIIGRIFLSYNNNYFINIIDFGIYRFVFMGSFRHISALYHKLFKEDVLITDMYVYLSGLNYVCLGMQDIRRYKHFASKDVVIALIFCKFARNTRYNNALHGK